jgi:hypothetical protein
MSSRSLLVWQTTRAAELDSIAAAHAAIGGSGRGRRWATAQINQAYAVLLSSQFQGFCRDLHSECVDCLVRSVTSAVLQTVLQREFTWARKLDTGNPNPGNIGSDFVRLGSNFWPVVLAHDPKNSARQTDLGNLNDWRNAIAHQDFTSKRLTPARLTLKEIRKWRTSCERLAEAFDNVMQHHLTKMTSRSPW